MWYVYVLYSRELNKFYIGYTNDLKRRIAEHRSLKVHTTARMKNFLLSYCEISTTKRDAEIRERQLKTGYGRRYLRNRLQYFLEGA